MTETTTDAELEHYAPWIAWREPMKIERISDRRVGYACRYCVAKHGLKGSDIESLPKTRKEAEQHIREKHTQ